MQNPGIRFTASSRWLEEEEEEWKAARAATVGKARRMEKDDNVKAFGISASGPMVGD